MLNYQNEKSHGWLKPKGAKCTCRDDGSHIISF